MLPEYLDIPIFPLPNVTFFPHTFLPLHVFEPRYKKMTANCLGGDRLMGVSLLKEGWHKDYFGRPPIYRTFGVGKIVDSERQSGGEYNIMLEGLYRVRLVEEFPTKTYRIGRVQVLQDPPIDHLRVEVGMLMKEVHELAGRLGNLLPIIRGSIQNALSTSPHPLIIANQLANTLVMDAYDRQSIFTQDEPLRRLRLLLVQLRMLVAQLSGDKIREEVAEEE